MNVKCAALYNDMSSVRKEKKDEFLSTYVQIQRYKNANECMVFWLV